MKLARGTSKEQIALTIEFRKKLRIKEGDKVLLIEDQGCAVMNSSMEMLREAQRSFAGEADRVGLKDEDDVVDMVAQLRKERVGR